MKAAIKNCLYCQTAFSAKRNTKKYCSDTCKQAAFQQKRQDLGSDEFKDTISSPITRINDKQAILNDKGAVSTNEQVVLNDKLSLVNDKSMGLNDDLALRTDKPNPTLELAGKQEPFKYIGSDFLDEFNYYIADREQLVEMFEIPERYWQASDYDTAYWVSLRLRCIVENILQLGAEIQFRVDLLLQLHDAIKVLRFSQAFSDLPKNYPYINFCSQIEDSLGLFLDQWESKPVPSTYARIVFSRIRKIEYMAVRFILTEFVPKVPFRELNFYK